MKHDATDWNRSPLFPYGIDTRPSTLDRYKSSNEQAAQGTR